MKKKKKSNFLKLRMPLGYDKVIHACVIILMLFGSIMVVSTSVGESANDSNVVIRTIIKQLFFVCASYFIMSKLAVNFFRWKRSKNFDRGFKLVGIVVIILLISTQFFAGANGSKAWIYLPGNFASLQPSEFAKVYLIILFGLTVNHYATRRVDLIQYMKRPVTYLIIFVILIAIQPDFGTIIVLGLIFATCYLIPTHGNLVPSQKLMKIGFWLLLGLALLAFTNPGLKLLESVFSGYKLKRFTDAANPFINIYDTGYNLVYSLYAIANGGLLGLGIGASEQKFGYLPEAQTDFILSVTIEELGIFGLLIIVVCYSFILYRLFYYAKRTMSDGYRVILIGCATYLTIHFVLNIGGVSGLIPLTGVPLLFMSAGGSSLLSISVLLGVCQAIIAMTKSQMKRRSEQARPF